MAEDDFKLPELEITVGSDQSSTDAPTLFSDEASALISIKVGLLESSLHLLTQDENFEGFCRGLLLTLMKTVQCEAGSFFEVDHENNQLFFRVATGQSSDKLGSFVIPLGKGIVGYVAESRRSILIDDVKNNTLHIRTIQNLVGFEAKNIVAVPVIIRGKIFGVIQLLNRVIESKFTQKDLEICEYYAGICSKAIEVRLMMAWALSRLNAQKGKTAA